MQRQDISAPLLAAAGSPPVRWRVARDLVPYDVAVETMENEAAAIANGEADELVWLVEHPPLYTAGTSADVADLVAPQNDRAALEREVGRVRKPRLRAADVSRSPAPVAAPQGAAAGLAALLNPGASRAAQ